MKEKINKLTDKIVDKFSRNLMWILITIDVCIAFVIWIILSDNSHMTYAETWIIGTGLFGSLSCGLCTLIALYISTLETRRVQRENNEYNNKQINIIVYNDMIKDYKNILNVLLNLSQLFKNIYLNCELNILPNTDFLKTTYNLSQQELEDIEKVFSDLFIDYLSIEDNEIRNGIDKIKLLYEKVENEMGLSASFPMPFNDYKKLNVLIEEVNNNINIIKAEINYLYNKKYCLGKK